MQFTRVVFAVWVLTLPGSAASQERSSFRGDYPQSYFLEPEPSVLRAVKMQEIEQDRLPAEDLTALAAAACVGGNASGYPCSNVDLEAFLPLAAIGGGSANDIWGWTDPVTGVEYALVGLTGGTSFVDLRDPSSPVYLGHLPTHTTTSTWRDIKVYADHAFIVSEAGNHGMQVFDLSQLRSVVGPPVAFSETAYYGDFGKAHNLVINEDSGFAFAVGSNTCSGGLHMVDIRDPTAPIFAGCFATDGYTHDAQCVNYCGPDGAYRDREICFNFNEDTLTIVDVTNKSAPIQISRTGYSGSEYTHQGWLTEDQAHVIMDDELDERRAGVPTRSHIWDVSDLSAPRRIATFDHATPAIDHNLYIKGNLAFESNYRAGLRILDISCIGTGVLSEVGFFDIYPSSDSASFNGTWSNYPYFTSGVVIVSGIEQGLFVLRPRVVARVPEAPIVASVDVVCLGDSVALTVPGPWVDAVWNTDPVGAPGDGATGISLEVTPLATTKYMVHTDDGTGCGSFSRKTIEVVPTLTTSIAASRPEVCFGDPVDLAAPWVAGATVSWSTVPSGQPGDGATEFELTVTPTETTVYRTEVTPLNGCSGRAEVELRVHPRPTPRVTPAASSVCAGEEVVLEAPGAWAAIVWTTDPPGQDGDGEVTDQIRVLPTVDTRYTAWVSDGRCGAQASATVALRPDPLPPALGNVLYLTRSRVDPTVSFYWTDLVGAWSGYGVVGLAEADGPPLAGAFAGPLAVPMATAPPGPQRVDVLNGQNQPSGSVFYRVQGLSPCRGSGGPFE